jgi:cytochrome c nitrite reductase small subunit
MGFLRKLIPPPDWQVPVIVLLGAICGLGLYIVNISNVSSYLSDDPMACINCHVMTPEYITWQHSSHREVTNCNDCHVPHDSFLKKYAFKARDGLYHASVYTLRAEPQTIVMKEASAEVVQSNCIRCHEDQVVDARLASWVDNHKQNMTERRCWECHQHVPHGRVKSLSAVGAYIEPASIQTKQKLFIPDWLEKALETTN